MLEGKTGLIMGVANKRSIAWSIAQSTAAAGARLVLTYQNERFGENVRKLAPELENPVLLPCDVQNDDEIDRLVEGIREQVGQLDFVVHALAFAPREALTGSFAATSREAFQTALDVSAYSLTAVSRRTATLMQDQGGSIITLTYLGSQRVVPGYNIMGVAKAALEASVRYLAHDLGPEGIRVNAISAGPIRTLASSAVSGISGMISMHTERAPLRRPTEVGEVADVALFLASPMSRGITGETIYVDGGYHVLGA